MKENPKVSVILPTYNRSKTLKRSILSVLNQSYKNFELIIIDDGSTDNTKDIIFSIKDKRIKYYFQRNQGVSSARNKGIKKSKGEYIAFQDSDDEWLPTKLDEQLRILINNEIGAVYCGYNMNNKKIFPNKLYKFKGKIFLGLLENKGKMTTTSFLIKKKVLDDVGYFDINIRGLEDKDLILRISEKYLVIGIKKPLFNYFLSNDSLSMDRYYFINGSLDILKKNWNKINDNKKVLSINYSRLAYEYYMVDEIKRSYKLINKALKIGYFNLYVILYIIILILGKGNYLRFLKIFNVLKKNI